MAYGYYPRNGGRPRVPTSKLERLASKWERLEGDQLGFPSTFWKNEQVMDGFRYMGLPYSYFVLSSRGMSAWGEYTHLALKKVDQTKAVFNPWALHSSEEPTYAEKIRFRQVVKMERQLAVEVFPKKSRLIDQANLYHIWLFPESFHFPFEETVNPKKMPMKESIHGHSFSEMFYGKKEVSTEWGVITYYLLHALGESELKWRQKQEFKDIVCGEECSAIEIIPAGATHSPYDYHSCIVCFPESFNLPFTL